MTHHCVSRLAFVVTDKLIGNNVSSVIFGLGIWFTSNQQPATRERVRD